MPPEPASKKYVEYMGGADAVLSRARKDYDKGNYRWVAQAVDHVVFADPANQEARNLQADALEQLGYQAESGPWRNFYLTGAKELRDGVARLPAPNTASPDTIRAMSLDLFFDFLGMKLNGFKASGKRIVLNFDFTDVKEKYMLEMVHGVLNHTADIQDEDADASITLTRESLNQIVLGQTTLKQALASGAVKIKGSKAKLNQMLSYLDNFEFWFDIVTP